MEMKNSEMSEAEWREHLKKIFEQRGIPLIPIVELGGGIRYDFDCGVRILLPEGADGDRYRIRLYDLDTELQIFDQEISAGSYFVFGRRYYVRYGIRVEELFGNRIERRAEFDATGKLVLISIPVDTVGDSIAWFSACPLFREKTQCELAVCLSGKIRELFESEYPEIRFIDQSERALMAPYAAYEIGICTEDEERWAAPEDYRQCGLHEYAAKILGISGEIPPPRVKFSEIGEPLSEPYVCISSQASGMCKWWMNPDGWSEVVAFLRQAGYRVIDIDLGEVQGDGIFWNRIPRMAEDCTGNFPLSQRAELIRKADFFIGLGSGLSWLAWCCKVPVVLVSGFSLPRAEFATLYRVINRNVCHGCYSDPRYRMEPEKFDWCPRHGGSSRHFECTRGITGGMVTKMIRSIPQFIQHMETIKKEK